MEGSTLCEVKGPLQTAQRMRRFLLQRARILVEDENSGGGRQRRLTGHDRLRRLHDAFPHTSLKDHCNAQVLTNAEILQAFAQPYKKSKDQVASLAAAAKQEQINIGATLKRELWEGIRRLSEADVGGPAGEAEKKLSLHEEDLAILRRLDAETLWTGTTALASSEDEETSAVMTGCQFWEAVSPIDSEELLTRYPEARVRKNNGDVAWCSFQASLERNDKDVLSDPVDPMALTPQGVSVDLDGGFRVTQGGSARLTVMEFFSKRIRAADAPESCAKLPEAEKNFALFAQGEKVGTLNKTDYAKGLNLHWDQPGPGCLAECGCVVWNMTDVVRQENLCRGDSGHEKLMGCNCIRAKKQCHEALVDEYAEKTEVGDTEKTFRIHTVFWYVSSRTTWDSG